jgi:hypothetical protein
MLSIKRENTLQFDKREMGRTFNHLNNSLKNYSYNKQMGHINDDFLNPAEENI